MSSNSPREMSPDDALPPVEPPSAGFIVQLFVVPGVIVVVVVMIWLMFNWLAHMGNDRDAYVRDLSRNTESRWQAAFNLATALQQERKSAKPRLSNDPQLAEQLADILKREIDAGSMEKQPVALRIYLCRALGEFKVTDGLPALIKAATTERDEREAEVRLAGLEGIAVLAANVGPTNPAFAKNEPLQEAILKAASDSEPRIRSIAAVAMGVLGGPEFIAKLHHLAEDANPDVRYNAATRLAHLGDAGAVSVLEEMLDQDEKAGVDTEPQEKMRPFKRSMITLNALRATGQLAEANPMADLSALRAAIEKLLASEASGEVRIEASSALQKIDARSASAAK